MTSNALYLKAVKVLAEMDKGITKMEGMLLTLVCHPDATETHIMEAALQLRRMTASYEEAFWQVLENYKPSAHLPQPPRPRQRHVR